MKVIFSRKGADGDMSSPIFDGIPISLPIPYGDEISHPENKITFESTGLGEMVFDLSKGKYQASDICHPDPDLNMGAFGQAGGALTTLDNQGVGKCDLFLFFGTFQYAEEKDSGYAWVKCSRPHHRLFGWLFVETIAQAGKNPDDRKRKDFVEKYPCLKTHPHAMGVYEQNNTIFIAPKNFNLFGEMKVPGYGKFKSTDETLLTYPNFTKSVWKVPNWLNPKQGGCGMETFMKPDDFKEDGRLYTVAKGQEFVSKPPDSRAFQEWLINLFETSS